MTDDRDPPKSGGGWGPGPRAIVPGRLRNWVEMTIQTRQAQRLIYGRRGDGKKPTIIGLFRYSGMLRTIWSSAVRDDPYADWKLLQIEQALEAARADIAHMRARLDHDMARVAAMDIGMAQSLEPAKIELTFSNPYAYMGAWLLVDLDELTLAAMTARHVGLLDRDGTERLLHDSGRAVRRVFAESQGYRILALTRDDVRQGNRKAERAKQMFGELPQAVLDGELRAANAPKIETRDRPGSGGHPLASPGAVADAGSDTPADEDDNDDDDDQQEPR